MERTYKINGKTIYTQQIEVSFDVRTLVAETGIRRGEICGLNVGDVDVNQCTVVVQRSRSKKSKLKATKAGLRNGFVKKRVISLSPSLTEQLHPFVEGRGADEPLFLTPAG